MTTTMETQEQRDARMAWWRAARFGMFIHFGLYSIPAGKWRGKQIDGLGEWIMHYAQIPVDEYEPLARQFNPVKFDADKWVSLAKEAGMKYVVITTKHHDGFCLFDSKHSDYDVMATPFRRDIMKELAEACRRQGLVICWYHSILDWHHPDYLPRPAWDKQPTEGADYSRYVQYLQDSVRQLLTDYGPIGAMWFDGEWDDSWTHEYGKELYALCRSVQPNVIVNNRVDKGRQGMAGLTRAGGFVGDFGTPEQEVPAGGLPGVDWETCMTMNDTWGFKAEDHNWKSATTLVRTLIDVASKGGNFLLNVGPTGEGLIPPPSEGRLKQIGAWMKINGESIYDTSASPIGLLPWGRCTTRVLSGNRPVPNDDSHMGDRPAVGEARRCYLHVFEWPGDGRLEVPGSIGEPRLAYLLADTDRRPLKVEGTDGNLVIHVPKTAPDKIASVVVLEIASGTGSRP